MNTAPCNCHTETVKPGLNERPRYYARQLVTPDDLTLDQNYFRAKLRRHNRYLHGWGVVCGAEVVAANQEWKVIVKKGYVLSPYGDEIFIATDQCIDVRKKCTPDEPDEDECVEARPEPPPADAKRFIAIRYVENKTRLIRVPLGGCGCEDNACEYSRFSDGYEICVIDECPASHKDPPRSPSLELREAPDCPECETEPWVVLSAFTVDANGKVTPELCDCRRHVLGFGDFWWACGQGPARSAPEDSKPAPPAPPTPTTPTPATPAPATPASPAGSAPASTPTAATPRTAAARRRRG